MRIQWWLAATFVMALGVPVAEAQDKPYKLIIPTAPGSSPDASARFFADKLAADLKAPVIVENRVGANGLIGTDFVARSPADGHTFLFMSSTHYINATLYKAPFDPIKDFVPVARYAEALLVLVVAPSSPFNSVADVVAFAKKNPGKLTYASAGSGSVTHLAPAQFAKLNGLDLVHIPYKGADGALVDTMGGQVAMNFASLASAAAQIKSGKLKALAVTGARRSVNFPDVPTMAESGMPGYDIVSRLGILAPAGTSREAVDRFANAVIKVADSKEFAALAQQLGLEVATAGPAKYGSEAVPQIEQWGELIKGANVKVE
ncbi:tripartite tricarboxylate transporter substrate binding protein [soil metagenome]